MAVNASDARVSPICVVPAPDLTRPARGGGEERVPAEWTRITEGTSGDDKPRWSPDGKTLYFISSRAGLFNVWGMRFDPAIGQPVGEPFRVTAFDEVEKTAEGTHERFIVDIAKFATRVQAKKTAPR